MNRLKSAKKQTVDGVLFLQGVFKTDCDKIEDFFHERLLHGSEADAKIYDRIPLVFTNLETWPRSTNLLCWNCGRTVKSHPWFEPQSIGPAASGAVGEFVSSEKLNRSGVTCTNYYINVKGCFCSANCVMRHILTYSRDLADRINKTSMLLFVYEIFTGRAAVDILPAPHRTELVQYGGNLTEQDYQKKLDDANTLYMKIEGEKFLSGCKEFLTGLDGIAI